MRTCRVNATESAEQILIFHNYGPRHINAVRCVASKRMHTQTYLLPKFHLFRFSLWSKKHIETRFYPTRL